MLFPADDIPIFLTSNYGEIRSAHFHAGVDMLVDPGHKVYAVREGYISRISVTLNGYGKLYILLILKDIPVFTDIWMRFLPEVEKYVRDQQYQKRRFVVDLYPELVSFRFSKVSILPYREIPVIHSARICILRSGTAAERSPWMCLNSVFLLLTAGGRGSIVSGYILLHLRPGWLIQHQRSLFRWKTTATG